MTRISSGSVGISVAGANAVSDRVAVLGIARSMLAVRESRRRGQV